MDVVLQQNTPTAHQGRPAISNLRWYFGFFVVSGFCGLVYEIVWLRLAMANFGVTAALTSIVISMFMAGLGLGSWGAGILTRRIFAGNAPKILRLYAIAELCVGVSSFTVPLEFKLGRQILLHASSFAAWQSWLYYLLAGLWVAFTLVPWCTCMGATFPLLMAVIRQTARSASDRSFSYLYVANVFGALIGILAAAFVLIEMMGFQGTLDVAGAFNLLLALSALALSFGSFPSTLREKVELAKSPQPHLYGLPPNAVLVFLFTTGLVSMGMEVIWIRQFTPYLGPFVYAFARILVVYLLATVLGSYRYRKRARSQAPVGSTGIWSYLVLFAIVPVVTADPLLAVGGSDAAGLRLSAIALFCAAAGFLTPLLVDAWSSGDPDRAGRAYAVNIAGSILGPLLAGFWLLPWLGERESVLALTLPLVAIAAVVAFRSASGAESPRAIWKRRVVFGASAAVALFLFAVSHDYETSFPVRQVKRDYAATVIATGTGFNRRLVVNGVDMTLLTPDNKFMVDLPLAYLGRPAKNGLIICFGMGTGFRSMLSWGIPTTAVDLVPSVPKLYGYYNANASELEKSPLARIVIDDGRRFLEGSNETYDAIVIDPPPPPEAPGSSLLYSHQFYEVIKKHLSPGGIMQEFVLDLPSDPAIRASVAKSLMKTFPYVRAFPTYRIGHAIFFLASNSPIPVMSSAELASRLPPSVAADFVEWGPAETPQAEFDLVVPHELNLEQLVAPDPQVPVLSDDAPINEYFLLRRWFRYYR